MSPIVAMTAAKFAKHRPGTSVPDPLDEMLAALAAAAPCAVSCAHCGWREEGPTGEMLAVQRDHMRESHPDVRPRPRKQVMLEHKRGAA